MIPKIIHYCWLSDNPIPNDLRSYMDSWKKILCDYEFVKWDFSVFDKNSSIWVSEAFDNKKYAFAADYIRLYAVYNLGGIYLDMDIEVLKEFDGLLDKSYMFATERPDKPWIEAGCFGAEKGNRFLGKCLEYYENRHFIKKDGSFDLLPLPQIMAKIMEENKFNYVVYPWLYFTAKSYDTGNEHPNDLTYTIHHFAGSWKTNEEKKITEQKRKLSKFIGIKLANNIIDLCVISKKDGINTAIKQIIRKIKSKVRI